MLIAHISVAPQHCFPFDIMNSFRNKIKQKLGICGETLLKSLIGLSVWCDMHVWFEPVGIFALNWAV